MNGAHSGGALLVLVGVALLAIPLWPQEPRSGNRRLEDRVDALEKELERVADRSRGNEAKLVSTNVVLDEVGRKVSAIEPENAAWIELRNGGGAKWTLGNGDEASVKFVAISEAGLAIRINHRTLDAEFLMRVGESVRAVDDRGTELRVYTTTLHGVERDRTGQPRRARISVVYGVESPG